ncbi:MAG: endonuclease [Sporolactobacillus sp.]|jgi:endonuclease-3 related protein|nr:endonuclease [Sporolactobacillus sp.]
MTSLYLTRYRILLDTYGPQHWWPANSTFEMLIGAILTQNTNWRNVARALDNLRPYLDPQSMQRLSDERLNTLIRPSGFYRLKTARIRHFLSWYRHYDFDPQKAARADGRRLRRELLEVNGIGRETADAMLVYGFGKSFFIADAYARRLFLRLGDRLPKTYDALRRQVETQLPDDPAIYREYHALIVEHGKRCCRAKPDCRFCPLTAMCAWRKAHAD